MRDLLQNFAMQAADWLVAAIPQPQPDQQALQNCKIISHRGEHDNIAVMENTLPAFDNARANGVWGIECDIRWTADLVPVISHDACARRVFGEHCMLAEVSFAQLRDRLPQIPSLAELVDQFGGNTHLMLEIKAEHSAPAQRQKDILREHLASLSPGRDYHFLSLDPQLFAGVDFVPRTYCYPVAELNVASLSAAAIAGGFGGLSGHYLVLSRRVRRRHEQVGQRVGVGFVNSRNSLFRELNRGIEWIFSNSAVKVQRIRDGYLE